jgi:hypothetical protein
MQSNARSQNSLYRESNKVWPVTNANEEIWIGGKFEDRISHVVFVCLFCSFVNCGMNFAQNFVFPKSSEKIEF